MPILIEQAGFPVRATETGFVYGRPAWHVLPVDFGAPDAQFAEQKPLAGQHLKASEVLAGIAAHTMESDDQGGHGHAPRP